MSTEPVPRPEHPRPQFYRQNWLNLNGTWSFAFDPGKSGKERGWYQNEVELPLEITVPFCPESRLSGIAETDFHAAVWYRRTFELTEEECAGGRILLHFGAVDYVCEVWINEQSVGCHQGGYSSFSFDISAFVRCGSNVITVQAVDDLRSGRQPAGKQSTRYASYSCSYTRTTGIWQTVWLEFVPMSYLESVLVEASWCTRQVSISVKLNRPADREAQAEKLFLQMRLVDPRSRNSLAFIQSGLKTGWNQISLSPLDHQAVRAWAPGDPQLYDLELDLVDANGLSLDFVRSYCGFRDLEWQKDGLYINGRPVFQRLILDQGFYPDGVCTAPSDDALRQDIEQSLALGFNGARLHQKVFEERFLYWADQLGYLVWGEQASWGLDISRPESILDFLPEWLEVVERDRSHPALIGWCPFNETWDVDGRRQCDDVIRQVFQATRMTDRTRPVIDTSGNYHVCTDIFDIHDYEQDPAVFAAKFDEMARGGQPYITFPDRQTYDGQPYMVSEYGGTWWSPGQSDGWGYGKNPQNEQEFIDRYRGLTEALLDNPRICGFCYTQLTDVEQEQNGLYTYARDAKFPQAVYDQIRQINHKTAAFERTQAATGQD